MTPPHSKTQKAGLCIYTFGGGVGERRPSQCQEASCSGLCDFKGKKMLEAQWQLLLLKSAPAS